LSQRILVSSLIAVPLDTLAFQYLAGYLTPAAFATEIASKAVGVFLGAGGLADDHDVAMALRMDGYISGEQRTGIPVGVYRAGGMKSPIFLDADFLVGPEAAHLNISGVSGLATKTSAIEWLLQSIFAHFPAHRGSVAAVCFNVKGPDLCFLDQPGKLTDADREVYELLRVPVTPFERVRYYAPYTPRGHALNTLRSHPELADDVTPLTWGLSEVLQFAEVLLNKDDVDAKADALIDFIRERVVGRVFEDAGLARSHHVQSFADLDAWFRDVLRKLEDSNGDTWRTHHAATIRKVRNRLSNLSTRCAGLVTDDGLTSDIPFRSFEDRAVYVVGNTFVSSDPSLWSRVLSQEARVDRIRDAGASRDASADGADVVDGGDDFRGDPMDGGI
jgi:hypothetical protein